VNKKLICKTKYVVLSNLNMQCESCVPIKTWIVSLIKFAPSRISPWNNPVKSGTGMLYIFVVVSWVRLNLTMDIVLYVGVSNLIECEGYWEVLFSRWQELPGNKIEHKMSLKRSEKVALARTNFLIFQYNFIFRRTKFKTIAIYATSCKMSVFFALDMTCAKK
jgi:hypothetical protein